MARYGAFLYLSLLVVLSRLVQRVGHVWRALCDGIDVGATTG